MSLRKAEAAAQPAERAKTADDRAERAERAATAQSGAIEAVAISVIIPTLNEAASLPETLQRLRAIPEVMEVIVADGGSTDRTLEIAREAGCRVVQTPPGRGRQLRHGAALALGGVVMFVHADTWLPPEAGRAALACLASPEVAGGGFWKEFREPAFLMRGQRIKAWVRLAWGRRVMGDQAMFMRRATLESIGGAPDVPLMEEFVLCKALSKIGRLVLAEATVSTSARRFQKRGVLRTYGLMWSIMLRYYLGAAPEELARRYHGLGKSNQP